MVLQSPLPREIVRVLLFYTKEIAFFVEEMDEEPRVAMATVL